MTPYDIYYFWDSVDGKETPPYIDLCLKTWARNAKDGRVVRVCSENIGELTNDVLTKETLALFTPAQRSDAAIPIVMKNRKGFFWDADTVLLPSFDSSEYLGQSLPTMYAAMANNRLSPLLAFFANPGGDQQFLETWGRIILEKIAREKKSPYRRARRLFRGLKGKTVHVRFDYLGAEVLDNLALDPKEATNIRTIDVEESGFCPGASQLDYSPQSYLHHWFGGDVSCVDPSYADGIVALQNSWIPEKIKNLSPDQIVCQNNRFGELFRIALNIQK